MTEEYSKPLLDEHIKLQEAALARYGILTNDLVRIAGFRLARVNGRFVKLDAHAFATLVLLAEHAIVAPGDYITTEALIEAITRCQNRLGMQGLSWVEPNAPGVHKAVSEIRAALQKAGLDKSLVELARGQGYRLNTLATNISIEPSVAISSSHGQDPNVLPPGNARSGAFTGHPATSTSNSKSRNLM